MHEQEVAWVIDADYNAATSVFAGGIMNLKIHLWSLNGFQQMVDH